MCVVACVHNHSAEKQRKESLEICWQVSLYEMISYIFYETLCLKNWDGPFPQGSEKTLRDWRGEWMQRNSAFTWQDKCTHKCTELWLWKIKSEKIPTQFVEGLMNFRPILPEMLLAIGIYWGKRDSQLLQDVTTWKANHASVESPTSMNVAVLRTPWILRKETWSCMKKVWRGIREELEGRE